MTNTELPIDLETFLYYIKYFKKYQNGKNIISAVDKE